MKKYNSKCLDCGREVPNGKLCICQSKNNKLGTKFETILREAAKKAVPIEDVRDALLEAVSKSPVKLLSKEGQKAVKEELKKGEFRPYHKGRGWGD